MTTIEWTEVTWNPTTGCDRISPGCDNCYALTLAARLKAMGQPRYQIDGDPRTSGPGFGLTLHWDKLSDPLRWRKPRVVFVNSMSDLFHKNVGDDFIAAVFDTMHRAHWHTFQVLTKRPKRMARLLSRWVAQHGWEPPENVWLGTSIESCTYAQRADYLRQAPAAVRFISAEPLLGPLVFPKADGSGDYFPGGLDLERIDWLICGGESGTGHRPVSPEWVRDLRDATGIAGTAFFFKQWGGQTPKAGGRLLDGQMWDEFPASVAA
jgi:protein gp37